MLTDWSGLVWCDLVWSGFYTIPLLGNFSYNDDRARFFVVVCLCVFFSPDILPNKIDYIYLRLNFIFIAQKLLEVVKSWHFILFQLSRIWYYVFCLCVISDTMIKNKLRFAFLCRPNEDVYFCSNKLPSWLYQIYSNVVIMYSQ